MASFLACLNLLVFAIIGLLSISYGAEEFCSEFPGEIELVYETLEDEDRYNLLYGKGVVFKYKKIRRTYRPRGYIRGGIHKQQVIQQQVQQQMFIPNNLNNMNNLNNVEQQTTNEDGHHSDNDTDNDPAPLPVWKLKMPRNAIEANVERVEGGKSVDKFRLNEENFENRTTTTYSTDYTRYVDVTQFGIVTDSWYAICISLSLSVNKKMGTCRHCTLLKAATSGVSDKVFDKVEIPTKFTSDSIHLKYRVEDLPFPSAHVITKVYQNYDDKVARCLSLGNAADKVIAESSDLIKADTVVYVEIKGLAEPYEYTVTSDLIAEWKDDAKRVPLTALFYLNPTKAMTIPKCARVGY